jgi:hypothetical protein
VLVALLALLGVPIWLLIGMVGAALWSRRRFAQGPGVFKCKLRSVTGDVAGVPDAWPRGAAFGRWVHDVLVVHQGLALVRNIPLPVAGVSEGPKAADPGDVKHLGDAPQVVTLRLDSGAVIQVAAARAAADLLAGPLHAAA